MEDRLGARLDAVPFAFPSLTENSRVFVLGIGGGCDVITAYAVSRLLGNAALVCYGNTKVGAVGPVEALTPHIVRVTGQPPEPGVKARGYGKAAIDHSVPRNAHGCPWIVRLDDEPAERAVVGEIRSLGFDLILGVDAGGDSIVARSGRGRDQRMLRALCRVGVPLRHIVVAPGCDGESSVTELRTAMERLLDSGRYRGYFALDPILPILRAQSGQLRETRTPRIILRAADGELTRTNTEQVIVPRGCKPAVPAEWLARAFAFEPPSLPPDTA